MVSKLTRIVLKCNTTKGERVEVKCQNITILGPKTMTTGQQDGRATSINFAPTITVVLIGNRPPLPTQKIEMLVQSTPAVQSRSFPVIQGIYTLTCNVS